MASTGWQDGLCKLWLAMETGIISLFSLIEDRKEAERMRAFAKVTMLRSGRLGELRAQRLGLPSNPIGTTSCILTHSLEHPLGKG